MTHKAGFRNIELNQEFFVPELRDQTLALLRSKLVLAMPLYTLAAPCTKLR